MDAFHVADIDGILTMSKIVNIVENTGCFISLTKAFVNQVVTFKLLSESIDSMKGIVMEKLSFQDYVTLIDLLSMSKNKELIDLNREALLALPLSIWSNTIQEMQAASLIEDITSVKVFI